jgi:hypothetical protein
MARARSGSTVEKGLKFFIYGSEGTWKSSLSLEFMKMKTVDERPLRVLYIDCETGSVDNYLEDLEKEGINLDNLYIVYTPSYDEVEYYANKAIHNEDFFVLDNEGDETEEVVKDADGNPFRPDAIVIDGITVVADNVKMAAINISEKRAGIRAKINQSTAEEKQVAIETAGLEFKDHDKIKSKGKILIRNLITNTDKYVAITGRDKPEKIMQKDNKNNMQLVDTGKRIPESWEFIKYEVFTVLHTFIDDTGTVNAQVENKDRTKVYSQNEIIAEPSLLVWQKVIDSNKGKSKSLIQEDYKKSLARDEKMYEKTDEDSDDTTDEPVKEFTSIEDYIEAINKVFSKMNPTKKKSLKPLVAKEGLPIDYKSISDLDTIKKFYEVVSK